MQIDWFTVIAQVVNFLVLVWLLKHFLYGRIVRAMDEREAKIASRLEEAARNRAEAEQEAVLYRAKSRDLEEQREGILAQSREAAEARRLQLVEEARAEVGGIKAEWVDALRREKGELLREVRERTGQQVVTIARRLLKDLAGVELEQQIVGVFLERVRTLEISEKQAMVEAIRNSEREVELRTSFAMAPEMQDRVARVLREHLDDGVTVRFEVEPHVVCGIELRAHSHRMQWNVEAYLDALEETVIRRLEERASEDDSPAKDGGSASGPRAGENGDR